MLRHAQCWYFCALHCLVLLHGASHPILLKLFSRRFLKLTLVNQFFAMESTLRLNISCLAPSGKEVRKLRIALPSTHTVQQLLRKVEAHPEAEGRSFKDLRLGLEHIFTWRIN